MKPWLLASLLTITTLGAPAGALAAPPPRAVAQAEASYKAADQELNEVYRSVSTTLGMSADAKRKLLAAELAWIKFRDAEVAFVAAYADGDRGLARLQRLTALTKARTADLWAILNEANGD